MHSVKPQVFMCQRIASWHLSIVGKITASVRAQVLGSSGITTPLEGIGDAAQIICFQGLTDLKFYD